MNISPGHQGAVGLLVALIALGITWLVVMPGQTRGKSWHFMHAFVPAAVVGLLILLPPGELADTVGAWLFAGMVAAILLAATWLIGTAAQNHGFMDVTYPLAPASIAWAAAWRHGSPLSGTAILLLVLVSLWSIRLATQTYFQNHKVEREPYASWRKRGGRSWVWWSAFQVHALQGVMLWIWSLSLVFAVYAPLNVSTLAAGGLTWCAGFLLQTSADRQLTRFRADPNNRGRVLDTGVWSYVRQPNYLGESLMWWGYFLCALAHPMGYLALIAPVFTTWFMGFGSAGPYKETHMARTRGAAWQAYCARTPRFFPWPRSRL